VNCLVIIDARVRAHLKELVNFVCVEDDMLSLRSIPVASVESGTCQPSQNGISIHRSRNGFVAGLACFLTNDASVDLAL